MRLSYIELENFKGVSAKQSIQLAPITLLFGPNSAGKSTILQALHYMREVLERDNPDPDQTIAGGLTDLGGFASLVHNHELSRPIRIKIRIDMSEDQSNDRLPLNSGAHLNDPNFRNLEVRYLVGENTELEEYAIVQEIALGLEVRWSDLINAPYVSQLIVEMDGEPVAEIRSSSQEGRAQLTSLNFGHSYLQEFVGSDDHFDPEDAYLYSSVEEIDAEDGDPFSSPLGREIWELSRELSADSTGDFEGEFRIAVSTKAGALPDLDRPLDLDLVEAEEIILPPKYDTTRRSPRLSREEESAVSQDFEMERQRRVGLSALLDELVLGPARIANDYLRTVTYIGPLREIPNRGYRPRRSPDESRWAQGLAAWDVLYMQSKSELFRNINEWLSSEERLRTGYELVKTEFKQISANSGFHRLFDRGITEDDLGDLQDLYEAIPTTTEIGLMDVTRSVLVAPSDVGVGISQMLPVVVACLMDPVGMVAIEQPELHIHPAIQVGMGDLFISATQGPQPALGAERTLLVETHSEHIMLRLLRRIREQADDELPPGVSGIEPDDVSVVYVESNKQGVQFQPLRVTPDGDFEDRWPKGFFDERAEELF